MKYLYFVGFLTAFSCATTEKNESENSGTEINGVLITGDEEIRDDEGDTGREDAECEERASAAAQECIDNGGSDADCELAYNEAYRECMGEDGGGDDGSGNDECEQAGEEAMEECYETGGTDEECRLAYAEAYDECVENQ